MMRNLKTVYCSRIRCHCILVHILIACYVSATEALDSREPSLSRSRDDNSSNEITGASVPSVHLHLTEKRCQGEKMSCIGR